MKKTQKKHKIQVILIVVALILGSIFVINKIASGETYASAVAICPAGNPNCSGGTNVEVIIEAATCSATGKKKTVCSGCNMIIGEVVTLDKNPNNHVNLQYDSDGNGHHSVTCKDCGKAIAGAAPCYWLEWLPSTDPIYQPTCQHGGKETRFCYYCGATEERDVEKVSHNYVYKFISNGTHAQKCEWCEVTLEGSEETCTYENGKCTKCGSSVVVVCPAGTKGCRGESTETITKQPTCVDTGTKRIYCNTCNTVIYPNATVPATGHTYNENEGYVCTVCGAYACPASNPKCSGGQREDSIVNEAKCTVEGKKNIVCSTCKGIIEANIILQATGHTYENGKCTKCGAAQPTTPGGDHNPDPGDGGDTKPELSGITTYKVNDKNMTNVKIATKASELIKTIQDANEGATVTIFNSNNEAVSEDETLATGMRIEVTIGDTKYDITIVIKGDTDGNGKAELLDIIKINKHRLNKLQLEDAYLQAADVNGDGKVDLLDIIKLNKFRLNKITEL